MNAPAVMLILLSLILVVLIDIGSIDEGDFYVKFGLRNKVDDFHWVLIAVYGAAQEEHKEYFLTELVQTCAKKTGPALVGGDFSIITSP